MRLLVKVSSQSLFINTSTIRLQRCEEASFFVTTNTQRFWSIKPLPPLLGSLWSAQSSESLKPANFGKVWSFRESVRNFMQSNDQLKIQEEGLKLSSSSVHFSIMHLNVLFLRERTRQSTAVLVPLETHGSQTLPVCLISIQNGLCSRL